MPEWKIVIEPRAKDSPHQSLTVAYLPDRVSAEVDLGAYVEMIERSGVLPSTFEADPAHRIPAAVVTRRSKSALLRSDTFEFERENSYDDGYAVLKIKESY